MTKAKALLIIIFSATVLGTLFGVHNALLDFENSIFKRTQEDSIVKPGTQDTTLNYTREEGEQDENGCLADLGYSYDQQLGVCMKAADLQPVETRAISSAAAHVGNPPGIRVRKILQVPCDTCYKIRMAVDDRYFVIRTKNGLVIDQYEDEIMGEGTPAGPYTSTAELMYNISGNVLGSPASGGLEQLEVIWDDGTEEMVFTGLGRSIEENYSSENVASIHAQLLDLFNDLDFTTDKNNPGSDTPDYSFTVVSDQDYVCNILLERNPILDNSHLQVACAEY